MRAAVESLVPSCLNMGATCDKYCAPDNPNGYTQRAEQRRPKKSKSKTKNSTKYKNTEPKKPKMKQRIKQKMNAGEDYAKRQMMDQAMKNLI